MRKMTRSLGQKINIWVRSILMFAYSVVSTFVFSFICIVGSPLPLQRRYQIIRAYLRAYIWMLKVLCRIDYQVEGLENIPQYRKGIILSKHQSTWETFYLPLIFSDPAIILKRELLWVPFFGWGLATVAPIAIDRRATSTAMQQIITQGKKFLAAGRWILVFPEGTRIPYGQIGKYKLGGARLAVETGAPVIPIAHNAGKFWPKRTFLKTPGTIHLVVGPLIESRGRKSEELMAEVKKWIESTVQRLG